MRITRKVLSLVLFCCLLAPAGLHADDGPLGLDARTKRKAKRKKIKTTELASVCSSVKPLTGLLIKAEISHHINRGDPRAAGYTLVCGRSCVQFIADFYYCDGSKAGSFGYYGTWNVTGRPRAYGAAGGAPAHSVKSIQATARRKGCGTNLYIKTKRSAKSSCLSWNALSSRTGSPF